MQLADDIMVSLYILMHLSDDVKTGYNFFSPLTTELS